MPPATKRSLVRPAIALIGGLTAACAPARSSPVTAVTAGAVTAGPAAAPTSFALRSRQALVDSIDAQVNAPEFRNMHWGILVVDPERGDTLYARNAGKLFMPASNQKLLTGAVALARLGADHRFRTAFVAGGPVRDGVLEGDLLVFGSGDPTISDHMRGDAMLPLREVADALHARGIRRVTGALRLGRDAFPDSPFGFGWSYDDLLFPYSAGVDELMFNEGFARVVVHGAAPGTAPRVTVRPAASAFPVATTATTIAQRDSTRPLRVVATDVFSSEVVRATVTGAIASGDSVVQEIAFRDQTAAFLAALGEALAARGIAVAGTPSPTPPATTAVSDTLFELRSPPLREILPALQKPSQNQIAEALLKHLAFDSLGTGTALAGRRIVERQLVAWGADTMGFAVRDGSGLSRHDYLTPTTIVKVLDAMRRHPEFPLYYASLPIAGVDGTIRSRMRGTPAERNVHAKTGTIDKARALSGYVTTADGRLLLFSVLANNHTVPNRRVERVQDLIGAWLAGSTITALSAR